ncbi:hypothetical protein, partial [Litorivivens sp.]|uniref:hypothetical protein n=1 Tax=Litorivivens sp. TaxID=2020868 RepID=UPI0035654951
EGSGDLSGAIEGSELASVLMGADFSGAHESVTAVESSGQNLSAASQSSSEAASSVSGGVQ